MQAVQTDETPAGPNREELREITRDLYDHQKLRIAMGNRLAGRLRRDLGQQPGKPTEEMDPEAKRILETLKKEFGRLADAAARTPTRRWNELLEPHRRRVVAETEEWIRREEAALSGEAQAEGGEEMDDKERKKRQAELERRKADLAAGRIPLIQTPHTIAMTRHYMAMEHSEAQLAMVVGTVVEDFPIWRYLAHDGPDGAKGVKGCGPLMAAVLVSELDPYQARHESSFWRIAGLDVGPDGKGRSRRKEHQVKRTYVDRGGALQERDSLTYNPFLKSKLMGALAPSLMRAGGHYYRQYTAYRHRLDNHARYGVRAYEESAPGVAAPGDEEAKERHREARAAHRHAMALRYMVKLFLADLHAAWRETLGLPVAPSYATAKLGYPEHYVPFREYWPKKLAEEARALPQDDEAAAGGDTGTDAEDGGRAQDI